jgi:hypothetical protein
LEPLISYEISFFIASGPERAVVKKRATQCSYR